MQDWLSQQSPTSGTQIIFLELVIIFEIHQCLFFEHVSLQHFSQTSAFHWNFKVVEKEVFKVKILSKLSAKTLLAARTKNRNSSTPPQKNIFVEFFHRLNLVSNLCCYDGNKILSSTPGFMIIHSSYVRRV